MSNPIAQPALTAAHVRSHTRSRWPAPGAGSTGARWRLLAEVAQADLPLVKVVEPHHDAVAILDELGGPAVRPHEIWAVWAAEPPFAVLTARETSAGWMLSGTKAFCSGAALATHALVTAETPQGSRLFAIDVQEPGVADDGALRWAGHGMSRAGTVSLRLADVVARPVGPAGAYTDRIGFWLGAIGIAACWLGGARSVAATLESATRLDPHGLAHRGAVRAAIDTASLAMDAAGVVVDGTEPSLEQVRRLALSLRATMADLTDVVIGHVGRALGPGPLAFDGQHADRVADLQVFVRQHHAERDLAALGAMEVDRA